jgi:diguanylate cyclase (GGDEF)-like protein/PAS domain S-box-containing protein
MQDVIDFLFGSKGMMPHGYCFLWNPSLLWLFVISNLITALSYFSIPLALGFFAYKRKDIDLKWMLLLFSVFIFACGITHVLSVVTIWNPVYGLTGIAEAFTAIVSVITAVLLWLLIPKALRIPSPSSLLLANKKLEDEILYHKETKAQLSRLNTELDRLVELRTRELQASEQRFRTIFEQAPLGIAVIDSVTGNFHDINPRFAEIAGRSKEEIISSDWKHITHPDDIQEDLNNISLLNARKIPVFKITKRYIRPDKSIVWIKLSCVSFKTETPSQYHLQMIEDITETRLAEQQIEHLVHYDSLTNLPNRLLLKSRVDYELIVAERHKKTFALLFIDLDHFKNINDSLGHTIGDQVLNEVGRRLRACVREEDTVARLGGDEFNILLAVCNVNGAAIVANKIIASLAEPILYQNYQLYITPSIGISIYPDNGDNYETLSKNADTALYQAKELGRNQYQFFTPPMQQQTQRRMGIENDLRQAIARNELMVYFQAQVNTQTGQIIGAEALLRWQHPVWGMVSPAEFIPVAEECGLILPIGDWVLEQSIAQARQWHDAGFPLTIAVNLSLAQFRANTLFEKVKQTLEHHHMPPQYLEFELTESIAMQNVEVAIEITHQITQLGIKLSIDDFGTGYSSLSYLQRFSLDKLKIDQSFTNSMTNNTDSENIVDAIISLAKSLNLKTIAEGVETKQQLDMFKQKKCDGIQGYYFSKPIPADEFMALMKKGL